jgi:hypothetical protein
MQKMPNFCSRVQVAIQQLNTAAIFFVCRELQVRLSDNKVISANRQKISQINWGKKQNIQIQNV